MSGKQNARHLTQNIERKKAMINKLTIEHVDTIEYRKKVFLWVNLITETETRQCCYTRDGGSLVFSSGDCEPEMSSDLRALFDSEKGDTALNKVNNKRIPVVLEV